MRYDTSNRQTIFLSEHLMGPRLSEKAVAKTVRCAKNTVQYWLNWWKESKDLSDMKRLGRPRATTEKVDQRNYKLAGSNKTAELVKRHFDEDRGAKLSLPISKPLLTENHQYDRLRWAQATCDID